MTARPCIIYGLADQDGVIRYVGKTVLSLNSRLSTHLSTARRYPDRLPVSRWLHDMMAAGRKPEVVILDHCLEEHGGIYERQWMSRFPNLLNVAPGGSGGTWSRADVAQLWDHLLGKVNDTEIAARYGIHKDVVRYRRKKLGVKAAPVPKPTNIVGGHNKIEFPQWALDKLGKVSDAALGEELGVSKHVVQRRRNALGIPSCAEQGGNDGRIKDGSDFVRKHRWGTA